MTILNKNRANFSVLFWLWALELLCCLDSIKAYCHTFASNLLAKVFSLHRLIIENSCSRNLIFSWVYDNHLLYWISLLCAMDSLLFIFLFKLNGVKSNCINIENRKYTLSSYLYKYNVLHI